MNKVIFLAIGVLATVGQLSAQDRHQQPPSNIQRSFQRDYPEAREPRWSSTNGQWHADFNDRSSHDRGEMVAHYDQGGRHIDSHIPYDRGDVPRAVIQRTESAYPDGTDYYYTRIEQDGGQPLFQVSLNLHGRHRTAYFDEDGHARRYHDRH
jgi:hypothetical protein